MEPFVLQEEEYFILDDWARQFPDLTVGFTSKNGGKSKADYLSLNVAFHVDDSAEDVGRNRQILAEKLAFPLENWVGAQQTHEIHIEKVTKLERGKGAADYCSAYKRTDGFFTLERGMLLTLCYADCVPLYFLHPQSGAVGIAHAGWKGTVHGVAEEMIRTFQSEGIEVNEILVAIGPSICENCYIVDDRVIQLVDHKLEDVENKPYQLVSNGQYKLNLKECNRGILLKTGVLNDHIFMTNFCTSCHKEHFFSHRRDQGKTGRMMSFIGWKEVN